MRSSSDWTDSPLLQDIGQTSWVFGGLSWGFSVFSFVCHHLAWTSTTQFQSPPCCSQSIHHHPVCPPIWRLVRPYTKVIQVSPTIRSYLCRRTWVFDGIDSVVRCFGFESIRLQSCNFGQYLAVALRFAAFRCWYYRPSWVLLHFHSRPSMNYSANFSIPSIWVPSSCESSWTSKIRRLAPRRRNQQRLSDPTCHHAIHLTWHAPIIGVCLNSLCCLLETCRTVALRSVT